MKLPGKEYYFLREVAEAWGCSVQDLFHYAIHRGLRIGVYFSGELFYGLSSDFRTIGAYFVDGVLTVPILCAERWEAGGDELCLVGGFLVEPDYPPLVRLAGMGDEDPLGPPVFAWARGRSWDDPEEETANITRFLRGEESLLEIAKSSIVIHAVERERFEAEVSVASARESRSDLGFSWHLAKQVRLTNPALRGDLWPKGLPTKHIAKLHFPESEPQERALQDCLDEAVRRGRVGCRAVVVVDSPAVAVIPAVHRGTVLVETGVATPYYRNLGMRELRRPADRSWQEFLSEIAREGVESSSVSIKSQLPNGMPLIWEVARNDGKPFLYRTCPIVDAPAYWSWEGRQALPEGAPLKGWIASHLSNVEATFDIGVPRDKPGVPLAEMPGVESHPPANDDSDASLGRSRRAQLEKFAQRNVDRHEEREVEWDRWRKKAEEIKANRQGPVSKRQLAKLVEQALSLPDSFETIRAKL
jgi:hypothetical protein